jgi:integrase
MSEPVLDGDTWLETGFPTPLTPLMAWGREVFEPVPDRKTLLKIAEEDGLNPVKRAGTWYVARKLEYKGLPKNLYFDDGRFRYRNPQTGERTRFPTETTKHEAIEAAIHLNARLAPRLDLIARVLGSPQFSEFTALWFERRADSSYSTRKQARSVQKNLDKAFDCSMIEVTLKDIASFLDSHTPSMQKHYRAALVEIYKIAMAKGIVSENLAERTERAKVTRKRPRLTMGQFHQIRAEAPEWLQIAMDFALYSLQRQGDILRLTYDDIDNGQIKLIQEKTRSPVSIAIGPKLAEVISRSRRSDTHSRFIVHKRNRNNPMRTQVSKSVLQHAWRTFAKEVADPYPTFHEIRSLGITMYRDMGLDPQKLAGHAKESMTNQYDQQIRYQEAGSL